MQLILTDTFSVIWLILNIYIIHGEMDWIVNERASDYGENVTLFCMVDDCCKKAAGWIKYDPDYTTIFLDVRYFKNNMSNKDDYAAATNSTGFSLVIKKVREDAFNIKYLCSYGFEKSRPKVLFQSDAFIVDEPKSELPLAEIIIGSIVAVVIIFVATVLIVKQNKCKMNLKRCKFWKSKEYKSTNGENDTFITEKEDKITQSDQLQQNGEVVIQTVEKSPKDNHSTRQPEQLQQNGKNLRMEIQNESENITNMHGDKENDNKE